MAFYKKEPTAFTQGNKGKRASNPGEEGNDINRKPESNTKNWNKQNMCTNCGDKKCSCNDKAAEINDWENKA